MIMKKIVYSTRNVNIYFSRLEEINEEDSEIFNISFQLNSIDWSIIKEESIDIISENSNCVYIGSDNNNMRVSLKDTKLTLFLTHRTQIRNINSIFPEFTINIQLFYFQWYSMWWINWLDILTRVNSKINISWITFLFNSKWQTIWNWWNPDLNEVEVPPKAFIKYFVNKDRVKSIDITNNAKKNRFIELDYLKQITSKYSGKKNAIIFNFNPDLLFLLLYFLIKILNSKLKLYNYY